MELWIRSQKGTRLIKVNNILACKFDDGSYGLQINGECFVGTYKTEERALEVLNDIQKILEPQKIIKTIDSSVKIENAIHIVNPTYETISQLNTYVYEMPEE